MVFEMPSLQASTPTTLHVYIDAPRFHTLLQDLESGRQPHQHLQHIHISVFTGYDLSSKEQLALYSPWTFGTNAQTWINSLLRYLPSSVQTFKVDCPSSTNYGKALFNAIQEATDASGRPWTIKVHRLILWGHRNDRDLVGLTSHFENVRQFYLALSGRDGRRSTFFEGAFNAMNLELLSITMDFEEISKYGEDEEVFEDDGDKDNGNGR